ncbi:MAG: type II and III secretion system protein family protein, partial [Rhodospirillales bacterium]|nr:type II and III secretion system protein family protein [Rhodospirillales bacterium]
PPAPAALPQIQAPTPPPMPAATPRAPIHPIQGAIALDTGSGKVVQLGGDAANVFVADPKIAEVRPASASSLFVFGVSPGRTTVAALDSAGHLVAQYQITISPSNFAADAVAAALRRQMPMAHIRVQAEARGVLLTGDVESPADAAQAVGIAHGFIGATDVVDNQLVVRSSVQVTLRVRIAEMSRQVVRNLGINWQALGTIGTIGKLPALTLNANTAAAIACSPICAGASFNGVINALAQDNLARLLAEPNLTVTSGQPASFLVGGQFPIPVGQGNGQTTITFKNYGVMLSFIPTVFSDGRISLHVAPEVSQLSTAGAVTLTAGNSSIQVPALTVSRAESTVELGSGQTFALAGLLQSSTNDGSSGLPGLGDIPVLGSLFRSDAFQRNESELVILVTPIIVHPVDNIAQLHLPTDGFTPPDDIQRLLLLRQEGYAHQATPVQVPGAAGFMVQ